MDTISIILWIFVIAGSLPTFYDAIRATLQYRISIDSFNVFAIIISFAYGDVKTAGFIILMLLFARLLDSYTESRTRHTLEELLKLRPQIALVEKEGGQSEISADKVAVGDIVIVKDGSRVPVDGKIIYGTALINESSMTGESLSLEKIVGDEVFGGTLNESGLIKVRAIRVGKDSTIERMAELIEEASKNKSRPEKLADRFAAIYLPIVLLLGLGTYFITRNIQMTAALFLVACADDMAVAIPLAVTAALGRAAKRGVVIKGGEWVEYLSRVKTVIVDKTGTLTYGTFAIKNANIEPEVTPEEFWHLVCIAEKFSEHPIGRMIFKDAVKKFGVNVPDPESFRIYKGSGVSAVYNGNIITVGNYNIADDAGLNITPDDKERINKIINDSEDTCIVALRNNRIMGFINIGDQPKPNAREAIVELRKLGVSNVWMFTGDNEVVARNVAKTMGIDNVRANMTPEQKIVELEKLITKDGYIIMVGDGVNDAGVLARADVGIAMGSSGAAVSVEAADVVILNDDLSRLPEIIAYSREVMSVIRWDMVIWVITNIIGFALVLTGFMGPALAAFYNFISDFFPMINSARLFK